METNIQEDLEINTNLLSCKNKDNLPTKSFDSSERRFFESPFDPKSNSLGPGSYADPEEI